MALPDALDRFDDLLPPIRDRERLAVFLDFDGTLAPIVERPEDARPAPGVPEALVRLAQRLPVALVSGRDLDDLRARVGLKGLTYAGSHGYAISGPGVAHEVGGAFLDDLDRAQHAIERELADAAGVQVERKRFAIAVHFRRAGPGGEAAVERAVARVLRGQDRLEVKGGKMIREVRPAFDWHKGAAVRWLLARWERARGAKLIPLYIGDDVTDEDAIRALPERGLGIMVGDVPFATQAKAGLADIDAVRAFLERLRG